MADELDLHLDAALLPRPERLALFEHRGSDRRLGVGDEREVDETGARHFGFGDQRRTGQFGQQQGGQFARIALERLGQLQRQVARKIPVTGLFRTLQVDRGFGLFGRHADEGGTQEVGKLGFRIGAHGKNCD